MRSNTVKESIKELDKQIESCTKQLNDISNALQKLKKSRLELVELQDYLNYEKWNIQEESCYIRFPKEYSGTLCEGFIVTKDDKNNKRFYANSFKYRCYDDEYSMLIQPDCISYSRLNELMTNGDVYKVDLILYSSVILDLIKMPDRKELIKMKERIQSNFEKIQ